MDHKAYIWGYHHRKYIKACAHACTLTTRLLAERCGFENINRFQRKRVMWAKGLPYHRTLIPVAFLDAIAVDWDALRYAVDRDIAEFDAMLHTMPMPTTVIALGLTSLGVCIEKPLPQGLSESELYEHVQGIVDNPDCHWQEALLTWPIPGLKLLCFSTGKPPSVHIRRPRFVLVKGCVDFGEGGGSW